MSRPSTAAPIVLLFDVPLLLLKDLIALALHTLIDAPPLLSSYSLHCIEVVSFSGAQSLDCIDFTLIIIYCNCISIEASASASELLSSWAAESVLTTVWQLHSRSGYKREPKFHPETSDQEHAPHRKGSSPQLRVSQLFTIVNALSGPICAPIIIRSNWIPSCIARTRCPVRLHNCKCAREQIHNLDPLQILTTLCIQTNPFSFIHASVFSTLRNSKEVLLEFWEMSKVQSVAQWRLWRHDIGNNGRGFGSRTTRMGICEICDGISDVIRIRPKKSLSPRIKGKAGAALSWQARNWFSEEIL